MELRTDDDIYRARFVWLGPQNHTMPIQLPYSQWGVGLALTAALTGAAWLLLGVSWFGVTVGICGAIPLTAFIFHHVDPDRPARKLIATAATDWRRTGPPPAGPLPRLTARKVGVTR